MSGHTQKRMEDGPTPGRSASGALPVVAQHARYSNDYSVTPVYGRHLHPHALKFEGFRASFLRMSEKPSQIEPAPTKLWQTWRGYVRRRPRSIASVSSSGVTAFGRLLDCLLPWHRKDYPGREKGAGELLRGAKPVTVRSWSSGYRDAPVWACDVLIAAAEARIARERAAIRALRAYRTEREARRGGVRGLQRIDPVTGLDGRNRTGRAGKRGEREL